MSDTINAAAADPRWRRQPEERPRQLLDAAVHVFAEHGIAAAKLEQIAARAGVSKGTIYLYFESKEELFREVVRKILVPRIAEGERVAGEGTASEQMERYLRHHWSCFADDGSDGWVRLVMLELHKYPELHEFYHAELVDVANRILGGIIERGVERGEFRPLDPMATSSIIKAITLMHVLWRGHMSSRPSVGQRTRDENINDIVDFVLHALRAENPKTVPNS